MAFDPDKKFSEMTEEERAEAAAELEKLMKRIYADIAATSSELGDCLSGDDKDALAELWHETESIEKSVVSRRSPVDGC